MKASVNIPYLLCLIALMAISSYAEAQDDTSSKLSFKAYSNFAWENAKTTYYDPISGQQFLTQSRSNYDLGYFSPALTITNNKGNSHELELSRLQFGKSDFEVFELDTANRNLFLTDGKAEAKFALALRYEYILAVNLFNPESRFSTSVGFSGSPNLSFSLLKPKMTDEFPVSQTLVGLRLAVAPRINYFITEKWFLDLNVPITVAEMAFRFDRDEDPVLPIEERKSRTDDFSNFPPIFLVRFGVGVKI